MEKGVFMKDVITDIIVLESTTQAFVDHLNSLNGPPIYKLTPTEARAVLEKIQAEPVEMPEVQREDITIPGPSGMVSVQIIRPIETNKALLPAIIYAHGGGWILGSKKTHARLTAELAVGADSAIVFVNYTPSPEAKFPSSLEEFYTVVKYVSEKGEELGLDTEKMSIAGDSVGGNMAIAAMQLILGSKDGPDIKKLALFYPVTSGDMNTESYAQFADGPWLTKAAMEWFWNAYEPNKLTRNDPLLSPLHASVGQLRRFPPTLIITDRNDVLRDEGLAFADKLMEAGVTVTAVCFEGAIHDFMMLNPLAKTPATRAAVDMASRFLS